MVTDNYAPLKFAVVSLIKGESHPGHVQMWGTFQELPSLEKLDIIECFINDNNADVCAVGWIVLQKELDGPSSSSTSDKILRVEQILWDNIKVMLTDKQVTRTKASAFVEFLGRFLPYGRLDEFFKRIADECEEHPNFAAFEIQLYIRMLEATEYDHLDPRNKHEFRQSIFTKITPGVLELFQKLYEHEDLYLFETSLNFLQALATSTWPAVDIQQLRTIFDCLLTILGTCDDYKLLKRTSLTVNMFLVSKPKECQDIVLDDEFFRKMVSLWSIVEPEQNNFGLSPKPNVALDMIMAYSQYLGKLKNPTQQICQIAIQWLDSFKLFCFPEKRTLEPFIRFLRILEQNYIGSAHKLYHFVEKLSLKPAFQRQSAGNIDKSYWNEINECLRFIVSCPRDNINAMSIFVNYAKFIFNGGYREFPESPAFLEGIFKTLKCSTNKDHNEVIDQMSQEFTRHINLVEVNQDEFERLIFLFKIKSYVAQSYCGNDLDEKYVKHIAEDIKFIFELLDKFKSLRMNDLIYAVTSCAYNLVEKYGKTLAKHPQLLEEVIAELSVMISELSCLQRVPLLEALMMLDENHQTILEHIELLSNFGLVQDCDKLDDYLGSELGFDTNNPTSDQLTRRKEYRGVFAILKVLITHRHFKDHGNEHLIRAICTQMYIVNNWRQSNRIHASYETGFTKNETIYITWNCDTLLNYVATESNPNSYFETMADVMFQVLETILKDEIKDSLFNNSRIRSLLLSALPENVDIAGPNFRLWLRKGFVCIAQSKLVEPRNFFHHFVNCLKQIVNGFKDVEVDDNLTPIFENEEDLNLKRLTLLYFKDVMQCFQTLMCSNDKASKEPFNQLFTSQVHEPLLFDVLIELVAIDNWESAKTVAKILSHVLNYCQKSSWQHQIITGRLLESTTLFIKNHRSMEAGYSLIVGLMTNKSQHEMISNHIERVLELNLGKPQQWTQRNIKAWAKKIVDCNVS